VITRPSTQSPQKKKKKTEKLGLAQVTERLPSKGEIPVLKRKKEKGITASF
jgi:hypothetical protein